MREKGYRNLMEAQALPNETTDNSRRRCEATAVYPVTGGAHDNQRNYPAITADYCAALAAPASTRQKRRVTAWPRNWRAAKPDIKARCNQRRCGHAGEHWRRAERELTRHAQRRSIRAGRRSSGQSELLKMTADVEQ